MGETAIESDNRSCDIRVSKAHLPLFLKRGFLFVLQREHIGTAIVTIGARERIKYTAMCVRFILFQLRSKSLNCLVGPVKTQLVVPRMTNNVSVIERLRVLKGRNKSALVVASNGRRYVQKFLNLDHDGSNRLFNEALGSQLGSALGLSFPAWAELGTSGEKRYPAYADAVDDRRPSSFGSELIQGEILEYLPGKWYQNVENCAEVYCCLLFDLWCNHTDSRQVLFQSRGPRALHAYFFDHDQMFSPDDGMSLPKRIAQARCLDQRIYEASLIPMLPHLLQFADRIKLLVSKNLSEVTKTVPASWGSWSHRAQAISGLQFRSNELDAYIKGILCFAESLTRPSGRATQPRHCMPYGPAFGMVNAC